MTERIGLISDTHGLLRPEAIDFLQGCDRIVHAGDICDPSVLDGLRTIAPLVVVRGNNDRGPWAESLPTSQTVRVEGVTFIVIHDIADLNEAARPDDVSLVVHGHSHRPAIVARDGLVLVNPGSAGRRRFGLPISVGDLRVDGTSVVPRLVTLMA